MNRSFLLPALMAILLILEGCQTSKVYTYIHASSVPDQTYEVTVYNGPMPVSYAILLDIPDDGTEVFMRESAFTEKIGLGSSRSHIDEFHARIKSHRTLIISDSDGTVRAYLVVSNLLNYLISPVDQKIMVSIEDPYHGYFTSGP